MNCETTIVAQEGWKEVAHYELSWAQAVVGERCGCPRAAGNSPMTETPSRAYLEIQRTSDGEMLVRSRGNYRELGEAPSVEVVRDALDQPPIMKSLHWHLMGL